MKRRLLYIAIAAALQTMAGCAIVPASTAIETCQLLDTAASEADMAPAWYIRAGEILYTCGYQHAREEAAARACHSQARNGYRDSEECEAP